MIALLQQGVRVWVFSASAQVKGQMDLNPEGLFTACGVLRVPNKFGAL